MIYKSLKNFDWFASLIYPSSIIIIEVLWIYPWLLCLNNKSSLYSVGLISLAIIPVASFILTNILYLKKIQDMLTRSVLVICGFLSVILIFKFSQVITSPDFSSTNFSSTNFSSTNSVLYLLFRIAGIDPEHPGTMILNAAAVIYLWRRGILIKTSSSRYRNIIRIFSAGIVSFVLLIIFSRIYPSLSILPGSINLVLIIAAYFITGVSALIICHIFQTRKTITDEDGSFPSLRRWILISVSMICILTILGMAFAGFFSSAFFQHIMHGAKSLFNIIAGLLYYIFIAAGYIAQGLIYLFRIIINLFKQEKTDFSGIKLEKFSFRNSKPDNIPPDLSWLIYAVKLIVAVAVIAFVIFLISRSILRSRKNTGEEDIDETDESVWSPEGFKDDLNSLLKSIKNKFSLKPKEKFKKYIFNESKAGTLNIREIYRYLLSTGAEIGLGIMNSETVFEYSKRLTLALPASENELNNLTGIYAAARYGDVIIKDEQKAQANSDWLKLYRMMLEIKKNPLTVS